MISRVAKARRARETAAANGNTSGLDTPAGLRVPMDSLLSISQSSPDVKRSANRSKGERVQIRVKSQIGRGSSNHRN